MSKKRNLKRKQKKSSIRKKLQPRRTKIPLNTDYVVYNEYNITYEPINSHIKIPEEIAEEVEELFYKSQERPEEAIERLETLIKEFPFIPLFYNYLSVAYSRIGNHEKAAKVSEINYKKNPTYLFAKLNYAEICIQKGELEKIPVIFNNKFEIKALYPERNEFHITEVVGFWGVIGIYFACLGYTDQAWVYHKNLKELAPEHPYTKKLGAQLLFSSLKNKIISLSKKFI